MKLDRHAIGEAAAILDELAVALAFTGQQPGAVDRLAKWMPRPRRLMTPTVRRMHVDEMARRLRAMLKQPNKGASRPRRKARRPAMTRKERR